VVRPDQVRPSARTNNPDHRCVVRVRPDHDRAAAMVRAALDEISRRHRVSAFPPRLAGSPGIFIWVRPEGEVTR
jgi:hypothetical protein